MIVSEERDSHHSFKTEKNKIITNVDPRPFQHETAPGNEAMIYISNAFSGGDKLNTRKNHGSKNMFKRARDAGNKSQRRSQRTACSPFLLHMCSLAFHTFSRNRVWTCCAMRSFEPAWQHGRLRRDAIVSFVSENSQGNRMRRGDGWTLHTHCLLA